MPGLFVFFLALVPALAAAGTSLGPAESPPARESALMDAIGKELHRSFTELQNREADPLYFLSYRVTVSESRSINGSYGALLSDSSRRSRSLDVEARVGSPALDSTHQIRGRAEFGASPSSISIPLEDDPAAIRAAAWRATDFAYKAAQERFLKVKSNEAVKVTAEDLSHDFSLVEPSTYREPAVSLAFDGDPWIGRVKALSGRFKQDAWIVDASVSLSAEAETRYYLNSEGTELHFGRTHFRVVISASTKADDGMNLSLNSTFESPDPEHLPDLATLEEAVDTLRDRLGRLRLAPVVEPFAGPAIIMNRACGVFFHEIFGHRIEGHRQKDVQEGQTFTRKVNTSIMPSFLSIRDNPTQRKFGDVFLNGYFLYDDEGVAAQSVDLVDNGVLNGFLMSRSPIDGFDQSNGHGRCSAGYPVVSRQGNLIVTATETVSFERLREMLIEEIKRQGKDYGLIFHDISGGFTTTQRSGPQAFKVIPLYVVRVYADGSPDELVRGVDLVGTPLASITKMLAAADDYAVFNGSCGAESGWVPVSAVAPSVLVSEMEIEKKQKSQDRPPILPAPAHDGGSDQ